MKHLHHTFIASDTKPEGNEWKNAAEATVTDCDSEEDALQKVKTIIKREHYHLRHVWECDKCSQGKEQMEEQLAIQRYMAAVVGKELNDHGNS